MSVLATVHLVRHGEVFNPDRVLYGRLPGFGLSDLGLQMADGVAEWFVERANRIQRQPAIVAASPLQRAKQTAAPIAAAFGKKLETEPNLIEAENAFEGMSNVAATLKSTPSLWPKLRNPARPSWGEPYIQQVQRMVEVVQRSRDVAVDTLGPGAEAILVSHQLPIWVTRLATEGRPLMHDPRRRECTLTSVTSLVFEDGRERPRVEYHEPNAHLLAQAANLPGA
ncbi:fructose-2,6-bisphosphatase [Micrococcus sp. HMSC067E09]|uniref:histidine phosphatase family protein n=1 Tax=Micrococcus TaxID=1269 RepID=UPI0008A48162|nr:MULTISPECIES: histidine phosphatase family protein [Micrococcus]OFR90579.1 fructose-2,6-bisphosphatase [Micrococcus sp. HMSC067E09]WIK81299.1 histidine phosphatase family protein [Micrococcus lylae]